MLRRRLNPPTQKACLAYSKSRKYTLVLTAPLSLYRQPLARSYAGTASSEFPPEAYYVDHAEDDYAEL